MSRYLQQAFDLVCKEAKTAETYYVALIEDAPFYGGPEEGGWWGSDRVVVAYQAFDTQEAAEAARAEVEKLADELGQQAKRSHGNHCLNQMEWLDARGLDADFLPEDDGPSEFHVTCSQGIPQGYRGERCYS
jgi:hypothetical protein